jgi:phage-related minor tail protein
MPRLVEVMDGISSGAIENYLDKTVGNLELGRINRGLVSGARATIKKASASSVEKGIPAMEKSHQKPVVAYFESLLLQP